MGPYIANYLEQVWLAGVASGWCLKCDAHPNDLDGAGVHQQSHKTTDVFIIAFNLALLWENYGIWANVPFTYGFPQADIHKLLSLDLLHQVIKGTFKDHIVGWVNEYLYLVHGETHTNEIIDVIDWRISSVPTFPGVGYSGCISSE
ncbi:hypothetical protein JAAARDRAFT_193722 [Jaapia argillacea MUCL 33604]|uniref:Uncharacterized protein n=1 Tax=Jaapia argillacea MUCL 33604 TaxID=933084 RepID=A0A067Q1K0_9AGAM|nr:hypothetical protein JAAARDRAFT_193722 [Jaapia argillacea MUCL 33604]